MAPQAQRISETLQPMALAESADPSALDRIARTQIAMAVWRRRLGQGLAGWLDRMDPEHLPQARFVAALSEIPAAIPAACAALPAGPERTALVADIADLAGRFARIMDVPALRVRIEGIEGNACRRFHQDAVRARLFCTYRGPATEWGYAEPGDTPGEIHALRRGEVAICKGSAAMTDAPGQRLLHRSPPIAGTGLARLLLVLDAADPDKDEDWAAAGLMRRR